MGYIDAKLGFNTQHFEYDRKVHCAYCNKEIEPDSAWDDYDREDFYHCDCEDALKEIDILKQISKKKQEIKSLECQIPKRKYVVKKKEIIEKI